MENDGAGYASTGLIAGTKASDSTLNIAAGHSPALRRTTTADMEETSAEARASAIRDRLPEEGLFAGHEWRVSPEPFALGEQVVKELEFLGRVLLKFYQAVNLLHRKSSEGKQPEWVADWLNRGKPADLLALQSYPTFKNDVPRVIRPDLLLTEDGLALTELDSVPGGIGLTGWLNQAYSAEGADVIGGERGMLDGFAGIFGDAENVHLVVSEESATYRPEMQWLSRQLGEDRFQVRDTDFTDFGEGDAVYRFFELFDLPNVANSSRIFEQAKAEQVRLTPPPKPMFEEKMLFALLWNRNLEEYWRRELGGKFFEIMRRITPYAWLLDSEPLPPFAAYPEINLTNWQQLKVLSQKERELIVKVSGFSEQAWGSRGVHLGSDLSAVDWSEAVDIALRSAESSPHILQRFHKPRSIDAAWYDFDAGELQPMKARVRLCPYYFVTGEGDQMRANLSGVMATLCPADKKIIHGMTDAIIAPCRV